MGGLLIGGFDFRAPDGAFEQKHRFIRQLLLAAALFARRSEDHYFQDREVIRADYL